MLIKILLKKNYRDKNPELVATIETESAPNVGDIVELDGSDMVVVERRWKSDGLYTVVESGTGTGVIKA